MDSKTSMLSELIVQLKNDNDILQSTITKQQEIFVNITGNMSNQVFKDEQFYLLLVKELFGS
jgi:hypothetical protein